MKTLNLVLVATKINHKVLLNHHIKFIDNIQIDRIIIIELADLNINGKQVNYKLQTKQRQIHQ